jgi:hypothetical protein
MLEAHQVLAIGPQCAVALFVQKSQQEQYLNAHTEPFNRAAAFDEGFHILEILRREGSRVSLWPFQITSVGAIRNIGNCVLIYRILLRRSRKRCHDRIKYRGIGTYNMSCIPCP